eukprot:Blabericola_migrator_1__1467@NODE_1388_length_4639_cov_45_054243_g334_i1_p8_GENE_NODE_1388_length_4639_cov_45_054243_g334_i1NODE_1388_length_4639_cov_45_054243_g334_i1_p8_ORF_typecomplete_len121_score11_01BTB/PF00651_31/6_3e08BTB/PF00651_31/0_45BACK/PF07707_15/44BACK/PF07707_15/0_0024THB/PF18362_1/3_8e03THB/PF18362_1/7_7e02THB/PF18362_1/2_9THB/PF18362_1/8_7e02Crisp/PF08562_10/2_8e02Crisp/PF08562_10/4_2_NODE_1388_length_4639_cov_45_054243_g334_i110591421
MSRQIEMPPWTYHAFRSMLYFLYSGERDLITYPTLCETGCYDMGHDYEEVCDTLRIADHFGVEDLRMACEHDLIDMINIQNVCNVLKQADQCQAKHLKEKCLAFVFEHADDVIRYEASNN